MTASLGGPPPCRSPCGYALSHKRPSPGSRNRAPQAPYVLLSASFCNTESVSRSMRRHASSARFVLPSKIQSPTISTSLRSMLVIALPSLLSRHGWHRLELQTHEHHPQNSHKINKSPYSPYSFSKCGRTFRTTARRQIGTPRRRSSMMLNHDSLQEGAAALRSGIAASPA